MTEIKETIEKPQPSNITQKSNFAGDVLKLVSGTLFAQVLSVLIGPILTRLYSPEAFGVSANFLSIIGIVNVIVCARYELAIMLPEKDEEAVNLLAVSFGSVVIISLLTIPLVWFGSPFISDWVNAPELEPYLWLVPPAVFVGGIFLALNYWLTRKKLFGRLSIAKIAQSLTTAGTQLGAGIAGFATGGSMVSAYVLGQTASTVILSAQTWNDKILIKQHVNQRSIFEGIKRYKKFPLYSTWSALMNAISWQLPTFLLSAYFSPSVAGLYALSQRIIRVPMSLLGNAIAQVFFQRTAEAKDGTLPLIVESAFRRLVSFGLFPLLMLTIIGSDLFGLIFGNSWVEAGVYTEILAIWSFFWFISSPLSTLYSVLEKQEYGLILNIIILTTRFLSLWIGGVLQNPRISLLLFSISGTLVYGYLSLAITTASGIPLRRTLNILIVNFMKFVPVGIFLITLKNMNVQSLVLIIISALVLAIYYLIIFITDPVIYNEIKKILNTISSNYQ